MQKRPFFLNSTMSSFISDLVAQGKFHFVNNAMKNIGKYIILIQKRSGHRWNHTNITHLCGTFKFSTP